MVFHRLRAWYFSKLIMRFCFIMRDRDCISRKTAFNNLDRLLWVLFSGSSVRKQGVCCGDKVLGGSGSVGKYRLLPIKKGLLVSVAVIPADSANKSSRIKGSSSLEKE